MLDRLADRYVSELFRYSSMLISGFPSTWPGFRFHLQFFNTLSGSIRVACGYVLVDIYLPRYR